MIVACTDQGIVNQVTAHLADAAGFVLHKWQPQAWGLPGLPRPETARAAAGP